MNVHSLIRSRNKSILMKRFLVLSQNFHPYNVKWPNTLMHFFLNSNLQWFAEMKLKVRLGWFLNVSMLQECYLYINYMCQTCACLIVSTKMLHALSNREYNLYLCHVFWTFSFSLTLISENCDVILYRLKMKAECAQWILV